MYSYTYGSKPMTLTDSLLLSLITASLNYPSQIILNRLVNIAGLQEFGWRYPILMEELIRRHNFENEVTTLKDDEMNLPDIMKIKIHESKEETENFCSLIHHTQSYFSDWIALFTGKTNKIIRKPGSIEKAYFIACREYKLAQSQPKYKRYLPFHTITGYCVFGISLCWLAWCLNYLLIFSAYHTQTVSNSILISFGITELETFLLIQPITLLIYIALGLVLRNTKRCYFRILNSNPEPQNTVPSLYYSSDPIVKPYSTSFSTQFAYDIFLNFPAQISHAGFKGRNKKLAYASIDSVLDYIEEGEKVYAQSDREKKIQNLYNYLTNNWLLIKD